MKTKTAGIIFRRTLPLTRRVLFLLALAAAALSAGPLASAEYFVSTRGSDEADGLSREAAFATIGRGVSALRAGDTLTILPGEYPEAVRARLVGEPGRPVTIRAERPGTALMRGCVDVAGFRPLEGARYTWWVDFDRRAEGFADRAALRLYDPVPSLEAVERTPGSFYQDPESGRLFVRTADSSHPDRVAPAVSVTASDGLRLISGSHDVVIEGLAFTGYNSLDYPTDAGGYSYWGVIARSGCERITVRDCTAFLNLGGIYLEGASESLVENCYAYANFNRFGSLGNNIMAWSPHEVTLRDNRVENFRSHGDQSLTFYGGARGDGKPVVGVIEGNLAINTGIMIKGAFDESTIQERNVIVRGGYFRPPTPSNLRVADNEGDRARAAWADPVSHDYRLQSDAPYRGTGPDGSDPGPFQWREEVFFVSPDGDDAAEGTSVARAWRTLSHAAARARAGQTVYVSGGVYRETLAPANSGEPGRPVEFRRRGRDLVVLDGGGEIETGIDLSGRSLVRVSGFAVRGFTADGVRVSGGAGLDLEYLVVTGCGGAGVSASGAAGLSLRHCLLRGNTAGGLRLAGSPGAFLAGNLFDEAGGPGIVADGASLQGLYSDYNAFTRTLAAAASLDGVPGSLERWGQLTGQDNYSRAVEPGFRDPENGDFSLLPGSLLVGRGLHAFPAGPYLPVPRERPAVVEHLEARAVTATTAVLEGWVPEGEARVTFEWGPGTDPAEWTAVSSPTGSLHGVGLAGLEAGRRYHYRASAVGTVAGHRWAPHDGDGKTEAAPVPLAIASFETLAADAPGRIYHVAVDGDDAADGLGRQSAWRTVSRAARGVRAGDTVLIHGGRYDEFVLVQTTGDEGRPVTFRAAPGETVWMEGSDRTNPTAFRIIAKQHVVIDGIRFRRFRDVPHGGGVISITGGSDHVIRRCFSDGRERSGYTGPFFRVWDSERLTVENCVMIAGMGTGGYLNLASDGAVFRHNVFYNQLIRPMELMVGPHFVPEGAEPPEVPVFTLTHNLFVDSQPSKNNPLVRAWHLDSVNADHNGYFMRLGEDERRLYKVRYFRGEALGPRARPGFRLTTHQGRVEWEGFRLADARERAGIEMNSFFGNPGFRAAAELVPQGRNTAEWWRDEMHWDAESGTFRPLDFADFFADPAGPMGRSAAGRPIGLDPAAFE